MAFALTTTSALALNTITLDENGNGTYNGVAIIGALVAADPSGGVAGPVLLYNIPGPALQVGDVLIRETTNSTPLSDVVRFWTNNQVIFYSDREAGGGDNDLADISGLPTQFLTPNQTLFEAGTEGNNGNFYLPSSAVAPGWDGNPAGTQYHFISDVPEPCASLLIGLSSGLFLLWRERRQSWRR